MPSHFAHTVFAQHAFHRAGLPWPSQDSGCYAVFGAQGPDIFYHNRRTKPSGLHYGGLLHRKHYGTFLGNVAAFTAKHGAGSAHRDFLIAAGSHAVLDRFIHPFINYFAGWHRPGQDPVWRFTHAFLERMLDVAVSRRFWHREPWEVNFAAMFDLGPEMPALLERAVRFGLRASYSRAGRDSRLALRLANAYADARGFYHFTNMIGPEDLAARVRDGSLGIRGLTILHPPRLPRHMDFLNEAHREWLHPCNESIRSTASFWDLYDDALTRAGEAATRIAVAWDRYAGGRGSTSTRRLAETVQQVVSDVNLSDGLLENNTCRREHADPLALPGFLEELRREMFETP